MNKNVAMLCLLSFVVAGTAVAQGSVKDEIELTRAVIQTERQAIVTAAMDLSQTEADDFWPLYREYRGEIASFGDRRIKLLTDYAENLDNLTELQARTMLDEFFDIEIRELKLKKRYAKSFRKILSDKKVTRFFQLDNKLDAVINFELAAEVPLVE
jgi:hypothetical protein